MPSTLAEPVKLPCGLEFPNRLVKAALAEGLANKSHQPSARYDKVYSEWGQGGWGAILTGNVMIDERYLGSPGDLVVERNPKNRPLDRWKSYANACQSQGTPALVQLNHPGRQSPYVPGGSRGFFEKTLAPSAIPLNIGDGYVARFARALLFGTPKEMTTEDIHDTIQRFTESAKFISEAGFAGIELHAAHGYLCAQFLSEKSNRRKDAYGGSPENRARFVSEVIKGIRSVVPESFCVGIKLNSTDHQQAASLEETLEQISYLVADGIDFLEISGGTYEDPQMMQADTKREQSTRSSAREAFFLDFAKAVRGRFPTLKLMLTGGFRTRSGMEAAVAEGACDIIGLGRPSVINTQLPKEMLLNEKVTNDEAQLPLSPVTLPWLLSYIPIKVLGAGAETEYYTRQIAGLTKGLKAEAPQLRHIDAKL